MRNARSKKVREYRKALRGAKGTISLWKLFDHLFPEYDQGPRWSHDWRTWWDQIHNIRDEWFREITRESAVWYSGCGNAPAWFRRDLNRQRRNKDSQALRDAVAHGDDFEDFSFSRPRKDVNWLWW